MQSCWFVCAAREDAMIRHAQFPQRSDRFRLGQKMSARAAAAVVTLILVGFAGRAALGGAAALCESVPPLNSLEMTQPLNLGELKQQIRHYACSGTYDSEVAKVLSEAQAYLERRAGEVAKPALVLDIDETSLSTFGEILANDFGFIYDGACDVLPKGPCGWRAWALSARAEAIAPTLALFRAARAKGVAVFFITGRRDDDEQRKATIKNLTDVGYEG